MRHEIHTVSSSLFRTCVQDEERRHSARVKELSRIESRLNALQEFIPAITAAGLEIDTNQVNLLYPDLVTVSVNTLFSGDKNKALVRVLINAGFAVVDARNYKTFQAVTLKKGRLKLQVTGPDLIGAGDA